MANSLPITDSGWLDTTSDPYVSQLAQPTTQLRWRAGVLEQRFSQRHYNHLGLISHFTFDWRPIPVEE